MRDFKTLQDFTRRFAIGFYMAYASAETVAEDARCFETRLVLAP